MLAMLLNRFNYHHHHHYNSPAKERTTPPPPIKMGKFLPYWSLLWFHLLLSQAVRLRFSIHLTQCLWIS